EKRASASREREGGMVGDLIRNGGAERATGIVWAVSFFRRRGLPVPRPFIYRVRDRGPHRSLGGWLAVILSERAERAGAKDLLEWPPPPQGPCSWAPPRGRGTARPSCSMLSTSSGTMRSICIPAGGPSTR